MVEIFSYKVGSWQTRCAVTICACLPGIRLFEESKKSSFYISANSLIFSCKITIVFWFFRREKRDCLFFVMKNAIFFYFFDVSNHYFLLFFFDVKNAIFFWLKKSWFLSKFPWRAKPRLYPLFFGVQNHNYPIFRLEKPQLYHLIFLNMQTS